MSELILNIFTCIIKGEFIFETLNFSLEMEKSKKQKIILILFYILGFYFLKTGDYKEYIYRNIYTFVVFYIYSKRKMIQKETHTPTLCVILGIYEIVNAFTNVITVIILSFLPFRILNVKIGMIVISTVARITILISCFKVIKKTKFNVQMMLSRKYLIYISYLLIVCTKIPFLYTDIMYGALWKMIFLSIICCTVIFFIISQLDRRNAEKEKARIEENNKLLSAKLHKSQEILPAMVQVLSDVTEKSGTEMEEQKAHKLLEEVSMLYEQQLKENKKSDLQLKSFVSTGLTVLDQQLNVYQHEAIDKEIHFDIFVQAPIDDVVKRNGIDLLGLQRAIGDLIRNSFQAVWKAHEKGGHILLIIGCRHDDILEIAVMDDGIEIPLLVLEAFGIRGVTTGGTGNGLADLREFVKAAKASICIDEFEGDTDSFTKKISIVFNGEEKNYLYSIRKEQVKSSFWNN